MWQASFNTRSFLLLPPLTVVDPCQSSRVRRWNGEVKFARSSPFVSRCLIEWYNAVLMDDVNLFESTQRTTYSSTPPVLMEAVGVPYVWKIEGTLFSRYAVRSSPHRDIAGLSERRVRTESNHLLALSISTASGSLDAFFFCFARGRSTLSDVQRVPAIAQNVDDRNGMRSC